MQRMHLGFEWPHEKDLCPPKLNKKKEFVFLFNSCTSSIQRRIQISTHSFKRNSEEKCPQWGVFQAPWIYKCYFTCFLKKEMTQFKYVLKKRDYGPSELQNYWKEKRQFFPTCSRESNSTFSFTRRLTIPGTWQIFCFGECIISPHLSPGSLSRVYVQGPPGSK